MKRASVLVLFASLMSSGPAYGQCYSGHQIRSVTVLCQCGFYVKVNACLYGSFKCKDAATFVDCGNCLVGQSAYCSSDKPDLPHTFIKTRLSPAGRSIASASTLLGWRSG
jgi:hypothetical protein